MSGSTQQGGLTYPSVPSASVQTLLINPNLIALCVPPLWAVTVTLATEFCSATFF